MASASLKASSSSLLLSSSSSPSYLRSRRVNAAIHFSKPSNKIHLRNSTEKLRRKTVDGWIISTRNNNNGYIDPSTKLMDELLLRSVVDESSQTVAFTSTKMQQIMYSILEAVADRIEMHRNVGEQRNNWNSLLLNSINMMTLTATTMVGLAGIEDGGGAPLKLSSTLLFGAATCMLLIMNKIQPSQLAEEQRNATRLFEQLMQEIQSMLALGSPLTQADLDETMERVLALDRSYPLPLLGKMIQKFPEKFEPAEWWPKSKKSHTISELHNKLGDSNNNGWSKELEEEMNAILDVLKRKDEEDYARLGNIALKVNKVLAVSGPALTAVAAATSAFSGSSSAGFSTVSAVAGAMAAAVNTLEHGVQVGMVVEMYRNCAGFFRMLEESIESTLEEKDRELRENGELFERKVALKLGRSLPEIRDLAKRSSAYSAIEGNQTDEFGSKLF